MIDFRSVERLEVYRRDVHAANLLREPRGCRFEYTDAFIGSGLPPIALHLPIEGLEVEGLANLPTYFVGLLPEGLMFLALQRLIRSAPDDLFAMLAATGAEAIGDIDVRVPGEPRSKGRLNLAEAGRQIRTLLGNQADARIETFAAIAGVQPKMSIGEIVRASRTASYIAKFEPAEFPGLLDNEHDIMRLAARCGLNASKAIRRQEALLVSRFDRRHGAGSGAEKTHVEDMLQVMDLYPNSKYSMEYADLMRAAEALGTSKATLLDALRLYVFSYVIGNSDLHAKNISLQFDDQDRQWRLTPAYDLLSTLPYRNKLGDQDRMALALSDESFGRFTVEEFVACGARFGLPPKAVERMVRKTASLVLKWLAPLVTHVDADSLQVIRQRAGSLTMR